MIDIFPSFEASLCIQTVTEPVTSRVVIILVGL